MASANVLTQQRKQSPRAKRANLKIICLRFGNSFSTTFKSISKIIQSPKFQKKTIIPQMDTGTSQIFDI